LNETSTPAAGGTAAGALHLALAAATAALLAPVGAAAQTPAATPWQVDSALLLYNESGGRVRAVEPVVSARRADGNGRTLGLKLTLDSLTGASPNGAAPQPTAQTFTSPSGGAGYSTPAGQLPLDPSFKDSRVAFSGNLETPLGTDLRLSSGASFSSEYDFKSLSVNAALARDFNDRNSTLSLGLAFEFDRINPVGGRPAGLTPAFGDVAARPSNDTRNVTDLLLGFTQVMSRRWLTQLNLGVGRGSGDHSDPYKVLSVVDGGTGLVTGSRYVHESRPDSRTRTSVFWQNKLHLTEDVVDVSYRYYRDDWGIHAHTLDARYRWELAGGMHLEPHVRAYRQTAADFWRGWLVEGRDWSSANASTTLRSASADQRLGAFSGRTLGLKFGMPLGPGQEFTLRVESYRQTFKKPANAPGVLQSLDLAPALRATTLVAGYSLAF